MAPKFVQTPAVQAVNFQNGDENTDTTILTIGVAAGAVLDQIRAKIINSVDVDLLLELRDPAAGALNRPQLALWTLDSANPDVQVRKFDGIVIPDTWEVTCTVVGAIDAVTGNVTVSAHAGNLG